MAVGRNCEQCGKPLGADRRSDARFCDKACKSRFKRASAGEADTRVAPVAPDRKFRDVRFYTLAIHSEITVNDSARAHVNAAVGRFRDGDLGSSRDERWGVYDIGGLEIRMFQASEPILFVDQTPRDLAAKMESVLADARGQAESVMLRANADAEKVLADARAKASEIEAEARREADVVRADADKVLADAEAEALGLADRVLAKTREIASDMLRARARRIIYGPDPKGSSTDVWGSDSANEWVREWTKAQRAVLPEVASLNGKPQTRRGGKRGRATVASREDSDDSTRADTPA